MKFKMKKKHKRDIAQALAMLSQIGLNIVVIIGICILLGNFLDNKFNSSPVFLLIFTILGVFSAFRHLYLTMIKKWGNGDKKEK